MTEPWWTKEAACGDGRPRQFIDLARQQWFNHRAGDVDHTLQRGARIAGGVRRAWTRRAGVNRRRRAHRDELRRPRRAAVLRGVWCADRLCAGATIYTEPGAGGCASDTAWCVSAARL